MEANEAPEKIYLYPSDRAGIDYDEEWLEFPCGNNNVEYIRTDVFIKKFEEWIKNVYSETDYRFKEDFTGMLINNFKNYIKGE